MIKGLTDRNLSFPEIGKIRKGGRKSERAPGKDLTYFRVEFDEREVAAAQKFAEVYGPEPREINILLPFNEIWRMWDAWLEAYTAGRMIARSDGEIYLYRQDNRGFATVVDGIDHSGSKIPYIPSEPAGYDINGKPVFCRPSGRLKVIIPELERLAYLTVLTTSIHDIKNISEQLNGLQTMNGNRIVGIPLKLRRRPVEISKPKADGTRFRSPSWLLSIEADPEWVKAKLREMKRLALPGNGLNLLPPGDQEEPVQVIEAEEFGDEDFEEAEFLDDQEDAEMPPELEPAPPPAANQPNQKPVRPYPPEYLRDHIKELSLQYGKYGKDMTPTQRNVIMVNLEHCFAGNPDSKKLRDQVFKWLTGAENIAGLSDVIAIAMKKWLNTKQDSGGEWLPDPLAVKEANAIAEYLGKQPQHFSETAQ